MPSDGLGDFATLLLEVSLPPYTGNFDLCDMWAPLGRKLQYDRALAWLFIVVSPHQVFDIQ